MNIQIRYFTKSKKGNTKKLADIVSEALLIDAYTVEKDLIDDAYILFLVNAMYAFDIDKEVKEFLKRNKNKIGLVVNINSSASGKSTLKAVSRFCKRLNIPVSNEEFHCYGSWLNINKGHPSDEELYNLATFVKRIANL